MQKKRQCICYGIGSAILFGVSGILASFVFRNKSISPEWLVGIRMFFGGIILLTLLAIRGYNIFTLFKHRNDVILLISFGILGVFLAQSSFFMSVYYGDAATATVLQSLGPTIIVLLISFKHRVLPSRIEYITISLALIGVFLLVTNGSLTHLNVDGQAIIWGIISAFGVAGYTLIPRPLLKNNNALIVVAWGLFIGGVVENSIHPIWIIPINMNEDSILLIIFITLGGTLLAYALYIASLSALPPTVASLLGTVEPLTATTLSVTLLQLRLEAFQFVGILLILSTVLLISLPVKQLNKIKKHPLN
ncbi:DMT family transporter [Leuconostoc palmae]|uniref:DMT family transporter n=1 Tax=Leuconostoc palmae TaxID=501487 RepID=UPI001FEAA07E|nr:EamA family transporter [Leuconostoc palmae]